MNCDHNLFLALNFDGGPFMDRLMLTVSGTTMWLPLYALILWLVWRRDGWRNVILFTALMIAALVLSDMISGIFKHNGVLGGLLPDFEPRWRPMFTPALEGLEIAPDSLRKLRWLTPDSLAAAGVTHDWVVHVPVEAVSGRFGTVSAHAAVIVTLAVLSASVIRRRWFTGLMVLSTLLICYSRIYLANTTRWTSCGVRRSASRWDWRPSGPTGDCPAQKRSCNSSSFSVNTTPTACRPGSWPRRESPERISSASSTRSPIWER